jgi:hypothetical protein
VAPGAAGTILVSDSSAGTNGKGALFSVNPTTGARTLLSDFGNGAQGPLGLNPTGVVLGAAGTILVSDRDAGTNFGGALFSVNPTTGARTLLSDFGNAAQGPLGVSPNRAALGAAGTILVIDISAGTNRAGALFRVNSSTGARTVLSDFGNAAQGPLGEAPFGVALGAAGTILVIDEGAGTNGKGALFSVNATTGARTLLSDFGSSAQGPLGEDPDSVAPGAAGTILVSDTNAGTTNKGALFSVNPTTGARTLLSDFGNAAQGPLGQDPGGVALRPLSPGDVAVIDPEAGTNFQGALFGLNPATGARNLLSDFGNTAQGPLGINPLGLILDLGSTLLVIDPNAGTNGGGALFRVNSSTGARTLLSDFGNADQGILGVDPSDVVRDGTGGPVVIDESAGTGGRGALLRVPVNGVRRNLFSDFGNAAQGPLGADPRGVTLSAGGTLMVSDREAGTNTKGALFSVNSSTGVRSLLSDFGNAAQGPLGQDPNDAAPDANGNLLVVDINAGTNQQGALFLVIASTGGRTLLSDFGNAGQGPLGVDPFDVTLGAGGAILVTDPSAGTNSRGALFSVNASTGARSLLSDFGDATKGPLGVNPARAVVIPTPSGAGLSGEWKTLTQHCVRARREVVCGLVGTIEVFNPGTATAAPTVLQFFLSADAVLNAGDVLLQEVKVGHLRPGQRRTKKLLTTVPEDARGLVVIAVLDATDVVAEVNEANNLVVSPPIP